MVAFTCDRLGLTRLHASPAQSHRASRRVLKRLGCVIGEADVPATLCFGSPPRLVDCYGLVHRCPTARDRAPDA